ncbi:MAG: hypothetical protein ACYTG6_05380 [Planctomycetota bacterium]|jgi:hypothetical protein
MKRSAVFVSLVAVSLLCLLVAPSGPAAADGNSQGNGDTPVLIDQGGPRFPIWPVTGEESIVAFYDYFAASAHTGLEMSAVSIVYFYRDETSGDLSLVVTHDLPTDGSGGIVNFAMDGIPDGAVVAVEDDPGDIAPADFTPPTADFSWVWFPCCTDGVAITLPDGGFGMSIDPYFVDGIDRWVALSQHPNGEIREVELDPETALRLVTPGFPPGR